MNLITWTTALLALIRTFEPHRDIGDSTILAWSEVLKDALKTDRDFADAQSAIAAYYRRPGDSWPIKPGQIIEDIDRSRRERRRIDFNALTVAMNTIAAGDQNTYNAIDSYDTENMYALIALGRELQAGPVSETTRAKVLRLREEANRQHALNTAASEQGIAQLRRLTA